MSAASADRPYTVSLNKETRMSLILFSLGWSKTSAQCLFHVAPKSIAVY